MKLKKYFNRVTMEDKIHKFIKNQILLHRIRHLI